MTRTSRPAFTASPSVKSRRKFCCFCMVFMRFPFDQTIVFDNFVRLWERNLVWAGLFTFDCTMKCWYAATYHEGTFEMWLVASVAVWEGLSKRIHIYQTRQTTKIVYYFHATIQSTDCTPYHPIVLKSCDREGAHLHPQQTEASW